MTSEGANDAVARSKLKIELERAESDAKQAKADHERASETLQKINHSELQQLKSSHTQEMETLRATTAMQLKLHLKETSAKSSDETLMEQKKEHEYVWLIVQELEAQQEFQGKSGSGFARLATDHGVKTA